MIRILSVPVLLAIACLLSGLYGASHNQISYSVSQEYFTKFKFEQFDVSPHFCDRIGAALVGWQASWWMGIAIGVFLVPAGMLIRDNRGYVAAVLRAYFLVFCTAVATGLIALAISFIVINPDPGTEFVYRSIAISDSAAYRRAGALHNFSYLGGMLGVFTGLASIFRSFLRENAQLGTVATDGR